jgi:hypothetical protein
MGRAFVPGFDGFDGNRNTHCNFSTPSVFFNTTH